MVTLDMRGNGAEGPIDRIQWGPSDFVLMNKKSEILLTTEYNTVVVYQNEMDDLIKALQKAKELWLTKM